MKALTKILFLGLFLVPSFARAGYYELFGNGAWYRYNYGKVAGDNTYTTVINYGGGVSLFVEHLV